VLNDVAQTTWTKASSSPVLYGRTNILCDVSTSIAAGFSHLKDLIITDGQHKGDAGALVGSRSLAVAKYVPKSHVAGSESRSRRKAS
jgi:hypothetical protein